MCMYISVIEQNSSRSNSFYTNDAGYITPVLYCKCEVETLNTKEV